MSRDIQVRSIKRREIDSDKLALAFLMLAKILQEREQQAASSRSEAVSQLAAGENRKPEAA